MYLEQNSFFDSYKNNLTDRNISKRPKENEISNYLASVYK